jgi:flagellar biosynthesis protein FliR
MSLPLIESFGLYLVRTSVLILGTPLLGTGSGFSSYKIALIMAVTVVIFLATGETLPAEVEIFEYAMMCFHEIVIGLFLAFTMQIILVAIRSAGEIIGTEMAFNMASIVNPGTGINTPLVTQVYEAVFFLGFLSVDGHHWMIRALGNSFDRAPIGGIGVNEGLAGAVVDLFSRMFSAGLVFAGPIVALLVLISVAIGLLSRVVSQINVMEVGFNLRVITGLCAIFVFSPYLGDAMNTLYIELMTALNAGLDLIGS